jgi:hypothetical protein
MVMDNPQSFPLNIDVYVKAARLAGRDSSAEYLNNGELIMNPLNLVFLNAYFWLSCGEIACALFGFLHLSHGIPMRAPVYPKVMPFSWKLLPLWLVPVASGLIHIFGVTKYGYITPEMSGNAMLALSAWIAADLVLGYFAWKRICGDEEEAFFQLNRT